jgi:hypothetical protein
MLTLTGIGALIVVGLLILLVFVSRIARCIEEKMWSKDVDLEVGERPFNCPRCGSTVFPEPEEDE